MSTTSGFLPWVEFGTLACVASCILYVGLRGLIRRKPFVVSMRWFAAILWPGAFKVSFEAAFSSSNRGSHAWIDSFSISVFPFTVVFLLLAWKLRVGYYVFGASMPAVGAACRRAVQMLGLPFQEEPRKIHLPSVGGGFSFSFHSLRGFGMIAAKRRGLHPRFPEIVSNIRLHLNTTEEKFRPAFILCLLALGLLFGLACLGIILKLALGEPS